MSLFLHGLRVQGRVLIVLLIREFRVRNGKNYMGLINEAGNVVMMIALFVGLRIVLGGGVHRGMEVGPFIACGMLSILLFRSLISDAMTTPSAYRAFSSIPHVTILDIFIVRYIYKTTIYMALAIIVFNTMIYWNASPPVEDWIGVVFFLFLASQIGFWIGIIFCTLLPESLLVKFAIILFNRIIFWTSGTFFVVPELPFGTREYFLLNPLVHVTESIRSAYFYVYQSDYANMAYLSEWMIGLVFLGLVADRAKRYRWQPR